MSSQPWFYTYVLPLTPTVLTIAGWAFVSWRERTKRISERKSKRIDAACELVRRVEKLGLDYYATPAADSLALGQDIIFELKRLSKLCGKISADTETGIRALRTAISGGDFQSMSRPMYRLHDPKMYRIKQAASDLIIHLDEFHDA